MQEGITVEALLDSGATGLVISSEFARKKGFKLKKLERPMQVRNKDGSFNREGPIENTVEVNVYYKGHVDREDAYKKVVGSCDRRERGVYAKKRKSIPFVERRERGDKRVCERTVEEGLHLAI